MSGGGKGGSEVQTTQIDPRLAEGGVAVLSSAFESASLPYRPNQGTTIAAFTPQQQAAFQGANAMAQAFGLPTGDPTVGMPAPEVTESGFRGYSTGDLFRKNVSRSLSEEDIAARDSILQGYAQKANRISSMPAPQAGGGGGGGK